MQDKTTLRTESCSFAGIRPAMADLPYPPIQVSAKNPACASLLAIDYCGSVSELSAITQYQLCGQAAKRPYAPVDTGIPHPGGSGRQNDCRQYRSRTGGDPSVPDAYENDSGRPCKRGPCADHQGRGIPHFPAAFAVKQQYNPLHKYLQNYGKKRLIFSEEMLEHSEKECYNRWQ